MAMIHQASEPLPPLPDLQPKPLEAYCIECGVELPHNHFSHLFCKAHYSRAKAQHASTLKARRCNICGGRMPFYVEHPTNLAHGDCLMVWLRACVDADDQAKLTQQQRNEEKH